MEEDVTGEFGSVMIDDGNFGYFSKAISSGKFTISQRVENLCGERRYTQIQHDNKRLKAEFSQQKFASTKAKTIKEKNNRFTMSVTTKNNCVF